MSWTLKSDRPIFTQLMELIQMQIISGTYAPGEKLPSVRDLASDAAVNPNTMQRALSDLEQSGLIYTQRTNGRFITEDKALIQKVRDEIAWEYMKEFFQKMKNIGYQTVDMVALIDKYQKEDDK